jgi:AcrR family transcriptional regulator
MGRPKASEARETRREILDAALELFAENGFFGTGIREIARAVGVRESAIYHHFPSKEALLAALLTEAGQEAAEALDSLFVGARDADLRTLLERVATGALEKFSTLRQRKLFRIIMADGLRLAAKGHVEYMQTGGGLPRATLGRLMGELLKAGRLRGASAEFLTIEFIGPLMMWRVMQIVFPDHPWVSDHRAFARQHAEHFLRATAATQPLRNSSHKQSERSDNVPPVATRAASRPRRAAR